MEKFDRGESPAGPDLALLSFCHRMASSARTDTARRLFSVYLEQERTRLKMAATGSRRGGALHVRSAM